MADIVVSAGVSSVAHGVHYTVLGLGLLGLVALLAPGRRSSRPHPDDERHQRVERLRVAAAAGTLAAPGAGSRGSSSERQRAISRDHPRGTAASASAPPPMQVRRPARPLWLPLAVVSAAAAAGVHAAVGPAHFREAALVGLFFAAAATGQLAWAGWMALRPTAAAINVGAVGNIGLLAVWLVSRTTGVPGVQSAPEAVGAWDLTCVVFELVVVLSCLRLRSTASSRLARWDRWDPVARWWALASMLALTALSISGASA